MLELYPITDAYRYWLEQAQEIAENNNGEIPDNVSETLDKLEEDYVQKVCNLAYIYKNTEAEQDAIAIEIKRLQGRKKYLDYIGEKVKKCLRDNIPEGQKFKEGVVNISWRFGESIEVVDIDQLPDEYVKIEREPIKKSIKEAIKSGINIIGAKLTQSKNVSVRIG